jgi:hypothetical protein
VSKRKTPEQVATVFVKERIAAERAAKDASRDAIEAHFAEWLSLRAIDHDPSNPGDDTKDCARMDRQTELARLITTTPAVLGWQIFQKLEVLECYLCANGEGTEWSDQRELVMLAGIKADLIRFDLSRAGQSND